MAQNKITRRNFLRAATVSAAAAAVTCAAPAASACESMVRMDLQILATSDTHGKFGVFDYSAYKDETSGSVAQQATAIKEKRTATTLVIDSGDTIQGNSADLFLTDEVHPMAAAINAIGYDIYTTGNHEYNYGLDVTKKFLSQLKAKCLIGNVYDPDGKPLADGYTIVRKGGLKIGVIGMVTPNITRWDAKNLEGWTVTNPVDECRKIIDKIQNKVDIIIGVMHMHTTNEYDVAGSGVHDLIDACPEFSVVIAGHGHQRVNEVYNGVIVVENQSNGKDLAEIHLQLERLWNGKWAILDSSAEVHSMKEYAADPAVEQLLESYDERAKEDAQTVVGELVGGNFAPANEITQIPQPMIQDTAMLDFINEVQMYYTGAAVSATAMTSMTSNVMEGTIRKRDLAAIYTYANTLYKLRMTGEQLLKFMEWSAGFYQTYEKGDLTIAFEPSTRYYLYDTFAGVKYDIDISAEAGNRIKNLTWPDGRPVDPDESFIVAVNNYRYSTQMMSAPSDMFAAGDSLPELLEIDVKGELGGIREMLGEYIKTVKGGVIEPIVDNNWKIIGNDWDVAKHEKAVELLREGKLLLGKEVDSRTLATKKITEADIKGF